MNQKVFKRRVFATGILIMGIACFFIYRLSDLHFSGKIKIPADKSSDSRRGTIKDKNGNILAVSILKNSLYVDPEEITNPSEFAKKLSPLINISEKIVLEKIKKNKRFAWIKRKLDDNDADRVRQLNLKGIHFIKEYHRAYPNDRLASNILGFVDIDNNGLDGIEFKYNSILHAGYKTGIFATDEDKKSVSNIVLTIDKYIQYISEKEIRSAVEQHRANQGVALVLEVKTGKILAYAKYPDFDPNFYYKYSDDSRGSFTITNAFEPGSTLKIIALAAILEKNPKLASHEYNCTGSFDIGDTTINCTKIHGRVNMTEIIKYSCNVGIMQAMKGMSKNDFYSMLSKFGFGEKTGIELSGESSGILRVVKDWSGLSKYSISIGQEISMTSVQLAAAFGAIANDGIYIYPTIIERIEKDDGRIIQQFSPKIKGRVISSSNALKIQQIMRTVVTGGTGMLADIDYYVPAGKTGTAQKSLKRGGYLQDKNMSSFIGLAPYQNTDICILVILDEPKILKSGGEAAAPVFADIARKALVYRGERINKIQPEDPVSFSRKDNKFNGLMPDFSGLIMSESIDLLVRIQKKYSIKYSFNGSGKVYRQIPNPGEKLDGKQQIILYLREY